MLDDIRIVASFNRLLLGRPFLREFLVVGLESDQKDHTATM
jgi:hypothetical protein